MLRSTPRRPPTLVVAAIALMLIGCEQVTDPTTQPEPGRLAIHANLSATTISTMVVRVSGPDISPDLVFNLQIGTNDIASGTLVIPAGSNRRIDLDAFDVNQVKTHHGERLNITVVPGTNPPMTIVLAPLTGNQEVTAQLGSFVLVVEPAIPLPLAVSGTVPLTLKIFDNASPTPNEITPAPNSVAWATTHPAFFKVDATGLLTAIVTGLKAGSGDVVVTYNGFAKTVPITVQ